MAWIAACAALMVSSFDGGGEVRAPGLERIAASAPAGTVEFRGVSAGPFDPALWQAGTLHWVFDSRAPMLEPRDGPFRNIYAPVAIREGDEWRLFYGAWDGSETPNDRIWGARTRDFRSFEDRHLLIDHGPFTHVCNCHVIRTPEGWRMATTVYPHLGSEGLNRPAVFTSPDGLTWNGAAPYTAKLSDAVTIEGYAGIAEADINGMNVLLAEDGVTHLYFGDFRQWGRVYRATSADLRTFRYDGVCGELPYMANDVKRFDVGGQRWYVMALHHNGDSLLYSLSRDGMSFGEAQVLTPNQSDADRYIVAVCLVTDGESVYGVLYGAGAVPSLDHNRLFAKWLQKRVEFVADDGAITEATAGLGPDTALLALPDGGARGRVRVYAEDGSTLVWESHPLTLEPGQAWSFEQ
jgi:hypothetical protein